MLHRLVHEPRAVPDFHDGILGVSEQFIGARLHQFVCLAFDESVCCNMIGRVEEKASVAGHDRSFWRSMPVTGGAVFQNTIRDIRAYGALIGSKSS
jgi:hypothetical protein